MMDPPALCNVGSNVLDHMLALCYHDNVLLYLLPHSMQKVY